MFVNHRIETHCVIGVSPTCAIAVDAEEELLSKGRWSQFLENEKFHSVEENTSARERCQQLLVGGVEAVDWVELCGQK